MEQDKRSKYLWTVVFLANLGVLFALVGVAGSDLADLLSSFPLIILAISLFATVVPVYISTSPNKYLGYGLPLFLLLPLPYFIYDAYTCTGKFCEILPSILAMSFGLSAIVFALFYTIGIFARKWDVKFIRSIMWIEIALLVILALWVFNAMLVGMYMPY